MSLIKKLAGETAIYGLSSILGRLVNWVFLTFYFTRIFAQGEYGVYGEIYTYIAILLVLFVYRMDTALFRFAKSSSEQYSPDEVFTTASIGVGLVALILTPICLVFSSSIAQFLGHGNHAEYVQLLILVVAFDALAFVPFARLRLDNRPIRFAAIRIAAIFSNIIFLLFFLELCPWLIDQGYDFFTYIYQPENKVSYIFWANLLASILTLVYLLPLYKNVALRFLSQLWKLMFSYSWPLVIAALAATINQLAGIPLLKHWGSGGSVDANEALVGIYTAAARLAVLMNLFIQAFNYAAEPFFFKQSASSNDKQIYADVARAFALVGALAFAGVMLYLDVIQYMLGKDFREGLGILPIMLIGNFFLGLFYNFAMGYKLTDNTRIGGYIAIVGSVITLAVNFVLIPKISYYGPAWASLSCYLSMTVLAYWVSKKIWPVDYPITRMLYYLAVAIVMWLASVWVRPFLQGSIVLILLSNTFILLLGLGLFYKTEFAWLKKVLGR